MTDRLTLSGVQVAQVPITTTGDRQQQGPVGTFGGIGVFTKEIQRALLTGRIDLAVHSLKDLPTEPVEGLMLAVVPERGPLGDLMVAPKVRSLDELPPGAVVGTGSLRRRAQLLHIRGDLQMRDIRGNVDTRLRKLAEGEYDAIVLAEAGLVRLGINDQRSFRLPLSIMLPAVGQGALGIECRKDDPPVVAALAALDHQPTHCCVLAERSMLAALRGGCLAPIGAWGRTTADGQLHLSGCVLSPDGSQRLDAEVRGGGGEAIDLGRIVAEQLIAQGASRLIETSRGD